MDKVRGSSNEAIFFQTQNVTKGAQTVNLPAIEDKVIIAKDDSRAEKKKWTFLHYGAGDNNLSPYIYNDVDEMEVVGSDANTNVISQLDQSRGSCKVYYLEKNDSPGVIKSPVLKDMGEAVNMVNPATLTDFIVYGVENFPADHVALIIGDHGAGAAGAIADDRNGDRGLMAPPDIAKALKDAMDKTGKKIDVLGFDCCLMANTEVAYELKDMADYMIASEEAEGGAGWPYNTILSEKVLSKLQEVIKKKINVEPKELAIKVVNDAEGVQEDLPTMSTLDLSKMNDVAKIIDEFAKAILQTSVSAKALKALAYETEYFYGFKDIYHYCKLVTEAKNITDENLKTSAKNVMNVLKEAIIAEKHSNTYPNAGGLQIALISPQFAPPSVLKNLAFTKDTKWAKAAEKIEKG